MKRYLLDTNIASHVIRGDIPQVRQRILEVPMASLGISAVTEAELHYGVKKRGSPPQLARKVHEFLIRVEILPWTSEVAVAYGELRATGEAAEISLAPLDMMIAAHAKALDAILVSADLAFAKLPHGPELQNWTL